MVSESSATGQPFNWVNRLLDCLTGLVILAAVFIIYKASFLRQEKGHWLLVVGYISIGLDNIIDAVLKLDCAPSLVRGCSYSIHPSLFTVGHMIESSIAGSIIFVMPLLWFWLNRASQSVLKTINLWFVILQAGLGAMVIAEKISHVNSYGLIQRFYLVGIGLWLAILLWLALLEKAAAIKNTE